MAQKYQFGDFTLDQTTYRLERGERLLRLEKIPMELLILLVQRQGELVTRDEIAERIWGKDVFLDVDHSINTAVRKVRLALRDDPEKPRFVETVVGKRYRFAAPVVCRNGGSNSQAQVELPVPAREHDGTEPAAAAIPFETSIQAPGRKWGWLAFGAIAAVFVGATFSWWLRPPAVPVVTEITQLTNDSQPKIPPC